MKVVILAGGLVHFVCLVRLALTSKIFDETLSPTRRASEKYRL